MDGVAAGAATWEILFADRTVLIEINVKPLSNALCLLVLCLHVVQFTLFKADKDGLRNINGKILGSCPHLI
jgi:hypothetical protein